MKIFFMSEKKVYHAIQKKQRRKIKKNGYGCLPNC